MGDEKKGGGEREIEKEKRRMEKGRGRFVMVCMRSIL